MTRESFVPHQASQPLAIVRADYVQATSGDCISASILNIFEYWANGAIASNSWDRKTPLIPVGVRRIKEFQELLLGLSKDKTIREKLKALEEMDFIRSKTLLDNSKQFWVNSAAFIDAANSYKDSASFYSLAKNDCGSSRYRYKKHTQEVFIRDCFRCVYCHSTENLILDHVVPQSKGGGHTPENLVTCCCSCNSSKGAKSLSEWRGGKFRFIGGAA